MPENKAAKAHTSDIDDRPTCPKCGSGMWLAHVETQQGNNTEIRTFKCPVCEISPESKPPTRAGAAPD